MGSILRNKSAIKSKFLIPYLRIKTCLSVMFIMFLRPVAEKKVSKNHYLEIMPKPNKIQMNYFN